MLLLSVQRVNINSDDGVDGDVIDNCSGVDTVTGL